MHSLSLLMAKCSCHGLKRLAVTASLIGSMLLSATTCLAQTFASGLTGLVTDPSGAAVASAIVRIRETSTNEERQTTTAADGRYIFSQLKPGAYEITVNASGFKRFVQPQFTLVAGQTGESNIPLDLGSSSQTVEVKASGQLLETQSAANSVTLGSQAVLSAPTSVRNPLVLVFQTAGVVAVRTGISQGVNEQNQGRFSLNGGRDSSTAVVIDGVPSTAADWGGVLATPSIEAVSEVQVTRNSYDSQYGRTDGGVVSLVTKSGSDQFHGGVYEYLRNSVLDANTWDNNRAGVDRASFQRHQMGALLGGPVSRKKHLYFFGDYEGLRDSLPATLLDTVPTALERQGDFSQTFNANGSLARIYNPLTTRLDPATRNYIRDPFPGNKIPVSLLNPVGSKVAGLYPLPNRPGNGITHALNYAAGGKNIDVNHKFDARIDWAPNEHVSGFVRVTKAWQDSFAPALLGNNIDSNSNGSNPRHQVVIGATFVPSPTWVTNILIGTGRWREAQIPQSQGLSPTILGLPASFASQLATQNIPQFSLTNYAQFSNSRYLNDPRNTHNLQVNNSKQLGNHSLRFGFLAEIQQVNATDVNSANFTFTRGMTSGNVAATDSATTGNAVASLLLGTGSSGTAPNNARLAVTTKYFAWYLQDAWRVNSRLTLDYGLRYEIQLAPTERYDRFNSFAFNAPNPLSQATGLNLQGGLQFVNADSRGLWDTDLKNWAPRVGLAYKITNNLVFRSGYGMFYSPAWQAANPSDGFSSSSAWVSSVGGNGIVPQDLIDNPFPAGLTPPTGSSLGLSTLLGQMVNAYQRSHPTPYVQTYSASFQYQLSPATVFEVGYSGTQGRKLFFGYARNLNQLNPQYLSLGSALNTPVANPFYGLIGTGPLSGRTIPYNLLLRPYPEFNGVNFSNRTPGASSSFNALLVKFNHRFNSGLQTLLTYQFSKAIDNSSETQAYEISEAQRNVYNLSNERSISGHDLPQYFTASVSYDLPFGRGRMFLSNSNRIIDAVAGGWQVSTAIRFGSGLPLQFRAPNTLSSYGFSVARPNITNLADLASGVQTPDHWFNLAAVSAPPSYTIGTAPRWVSNLRTGALDSADISLMKYFTLTERVKLQIRADAFNVSNTPQYGRADTTLGSNTFGVITSSTNVTERNIQLGARIQF